MPSRRDVPVGIRHHQDTRDHADGIDFQYPTGRRRRPGGGWMPDGHRTDTSGIRTPVAYRVEWTPGRVRMCILNREPFVSAEFGCRGGWTPLGPTASHLSSRSLLQWRREREREREPGICIFFSGGMWSPQSFQRRSFRGGCFFQIDAQCTHC